MPSDANSRRGDDATESAMTHFAREMTQEQVAFQAE
jgi:hypothetical protein